MGSPKENQTNDSRKEINERLLEELEAFKFYNKKTNDEFTEFFGFSRHKPYNWRNGKQDPNPTAEDLYQIEMIQRSPKGALLKYKINTFYIYSGFKTMESEDKKDETIKAQENIIRDLNIKIIKMEG